MHLKFVYCNAYTNFSHEIYEFYNLGIGDPFPMSAANALGIGDVLDAIYEKLPEKNENDDEEDVSKKIRSLTDDFNNLIIIASKSNIFIM